MEENDLDSEVEHDKIKKYGNTEHFFYVQCNNSGLLIDTDYAGTLSAFYQAIKAENITLRDIKYVLATHYHPGPYRACKYTDETGSETSSHRCAS